MNHVLILTPYPLRLAPLHEWFNAVCDKVYVVGSPDLFKGISRSEITQISEHIEILRIFEDYRSNTGFIGAVSELITRFGIARIVALDEWDVERSAILREKHGLVGQTFSSARSYRFKHVMKEMACDVISVPKHYVGSSITEGYHFLNLLGFPAVIKPLYGAASRDTHILKSIDEYQDVVNKKDLPIPYLMEEYVDAYMYHVDGLVVNGEVIFCVPSKYINTCLSYRQGTGHGGFNVSWNDPESDQLVSNVKSIISALPHFDGGAFHAEIWITESGESVFCEIAARCGGGGIREAINQRFKVDLLKCHALIQAGYEVIAPTVAINDDCCGWYIITPHEGLLIDYPDKCDLSDVIEFVQSGERGKFYSSAESSASQYQKYIFKAPSYDHAVAFTRHIEEWSEKTSRWILNSDQI